MIKEFSVAVYNALNICKKVRNIRMPNGGCDGSSFLSARLHLKLTKAQGVGHNCEGPFWIGLSEVRRPTPSWGNLHKGHEKRKLLLFVFLLSLCQVHSLLILEPTSDIH